MKNAFSILPMVGGCLAMVLSISSCSDKMDEEVVAGNPADQVPTEVVTKLKNLGFAPNQIKLHENGYLVEGDIIVTEEALAEMGSNVVSVPNAAGEEQYRTSSLVNCNGGRTIRIYSTITSGVRSTGLDYAIANWNAVRTCFTFQRVYSGSYNIIVRSQSGSGGLAGFPSGGNPYGTVYLGSSISNDQAAEHVATHEIGHCFGLRHSDWFDRRTCGQNSPESTAIHIPGTPTGFDSSSLMNACYPSNTNGEFNSNDRYAIEYLY